MNNFSPEKLVQWYFIQLTDGCDKFVECENGLCKSSQFFVYKTKITNNTIAIYKATKLALKYTDKMICPNILRSNFDTELLSARIDIDSDFRKYRESVKERRRHQFTYFHYMFRSLDLFQTVLRSNNDPLSFSNMSLDENDLIALLDYSRFCGAKDIIKENFSDIVRKLHMSSEFREPNYQNSICTYHQIRALFLELACLPILFDEKNADYSDVAMVLQTILNLSEAKIVKGSQLFWKNFSFFTNFARHINDFLKILFKKKDKTERFKKHVIISKFLTFVYKNTNLDATIFYNDYASKIYNQIDIVSTGLMDYPLIFKPELKHRCLKLKSANEPVSCRMIVVDRNNIIDSLRRQISGIKDGLFRQCRLKVHFKDEEGNDEGGLSRELFVSALKELFHPDFGLFNLIEENQCHWFKYEYSHETLYYNFVGKLCSLCLYNDITIPVRFPLVLYKKLLNIDLTFDDIKEINPGVYNSIKNIEKMILNGEDISVCCLTFIAPNSETEKEIVPNGKDMEVTNDNFQEYMFCVKEWMLERGIENQYINFKRGFEKTISSNIVKNFLPEELSEILSGSFEYDWEALCKRMEFRPRNQVSIHHKKLFLEVFRSLTHEEKLKFLTFVTGSDVPPYGGLSNLVITVDFIQDTNILPVSHTCCSMIHIPVYKTFEEMKSKMLLSLRHSEGFGLA